MKNLIFIISIFSLLGCSQNTDGTVAKDPFVNNALSILEELSDYYPQKDIDLLFSKVDSNGFQSATFKLQGETKETIGLGIFAQSEYAVDQSDGTNCTNKWECGKKIKKCLDNGDDALISNGPCESSVWCVKCIESE